jgi:hypothetical protein
MTNATAPMRQTRNLYLRQDVIIGRILAHLATLESTDIGVQEQIGRLQQDRNPANLATFLRDHNVTITCRAMSISLEADREGTLTTRTPTCAPTLDERIPRQRGQHRKTQARHQPTAMPRGD